MYLYAEDTISQGRVDMSEQECPCGYVYEPDEGDYQSGIEPGTPFDELPENWVCPKCGAEKEHFEKTD